MTLKIDTFSNTAGGNAFYKAIVHPLAAAKAADLLQTLRVQGPVALYDPYGFLSGFDEFYPLKSVAIAGYYVQNVEHLDREFRGHRARPITDLPNVGSGPASCKSVLVAAFDAEKPVSHIRHLVPEGAQLFSFDALRLPSEMLSGGGRYLSTLNFATNYAFFRDEGGHHTRIVTANYWAQYGSATQHLWLCLFDDKGNKLASWTEGLPPAGAPVVIDSREIRARLNLPEFTGQLFMHVIGAAGHDVVKYALDTYGDTDEVLSCTHDANSWPSDFYAGLPAPDKDERVVLWLQNSHPRTIPAGEIALNLMGDSKSVPLVREIAPFSTYALDVAELLPAARWPQQIEIQASKNFVRPRYEVLNKNGRSRIAHPNVERGDLKPDRRLPELANLLGKLFILPAPILPVDRYRSVLQPTPMATTQAHLPLKAVVYDSLGHKAAEKSLGNMARSESIALDVNGLLNGHELEGGYGHVELLYDFDVGSEADGWLHALFRYSDRQTQHQAETSFGAHIFNTVLTYKNEPQSYSGPAPGLSTRLFLRVGPAGSDTMCHLIYAASQPWHALSETALILIGETGDEIARRDVQIPCGGSLHWRVSKTFTEAERAAAGEASYVLIRDTTCRLFGYHGLTNGRAFSLDHMFGF
jgi:hypothetical protein